jgi:hypothetical protein
VPQTSSEREAAQAAFRGAARALFISGDTIAAFLDLRDARPGRGVHGDARVGDRPPRQGEAGAPAQAGAVPGAEVRRRASTGPT